MADGASAMNKLDKLARLKSLKSGLKASDNAKQVESAPLTLDAMLAEEGLVSEQAAATVEPTPAPEKPVLSKPESPKTNASMEKDGESLSSYFEALGIVPDDAKVAGATGKAPDEYKSPSDEYAEPAPVKTPGREVDERDLWADPVRNDDTFLSSFAAGGDAAKDVEEDIPSLDSIIGSMGDEEIEPPVVEAPVIEAPVVEPVIEAETVKADDIDDIPVDIEAFEAEIALKESEITEEEPVATIPPAEKTVEAEQPLTITFDKSRATLLSHVSKQMGCSIDDVVVTAIDWYLDALFGEEDPDLAAGQGD